MLSVNVIVPLCFIFAFSYVTGDIDSNCLNCICKVESCCSAKGCVPDAGSPSCGYFQIKEKYYIDCGQPGMRHGESNDTAWKRCANDYNCAKKCVTDYVNRYAPLCKPNPTCETYARVHNGGPNGCKKSSTDPYWKKVQACHC